MDGADQCCVVGFGLIGVAPRELAQCLINPGVELLQAQGGHALLDLQLGRLHTDVGTALRERRHDRQTMHRNADWKSDTRTTPAGWPAAMPAGSASAASSGRRGVADERSPGLGKTHIAPDTLEQPRPGFAVEHGELLRGEAQRAPTLAHVAVRYFDNAMHSPIRHWRVDLSPRWIRVRWTLRPLAAG